MNIQSVDNIAAYCRQIFHVLKRASKPILEELGLTKVDAKILLMLYKQPESTKTELAERLCFDANSLTRSLDRLVDMKAVNRITAREDNRFIKLSLTDKGNSIAKKLYGCLAKYLGTPIRKPFFTRD